MAKQLSAWRIRRLEKRVNFQLVNKIISFLLAHKIHSSFENLMVPEPIVGRSRDRFPVSPGFFPWHLTVPCALGLTQPLKMSTRLILGVKAAGA
jgi:hypothetical protein